jgi:hypothetical protein
MSVEKEGRGLDHDHAGGAAIKMAIGQSEKRHPLSLALPTAASFSHCSACFGVMPASSDARQVKHWGAPDAICLAVSLSALDPKRAFSGAATPNSAQHSAPIRR